MSTQPEQQVSEAAMRLLNEFAATSEKHTQFAQDIKLVAQRAIDASQPASATPDEMRVQALADHEGLLQCRALLGVQEGDNLYDAIKRILPDKKRLDWLEQHPFTAYRHSDIESGVVPHAVVVDEAISPRTGIVQKTLREAIDIALAASATDSRAAERAQADAYYAQEQEYHAEISAPAAESAQEGHKYAYVTAMLKDDATLRNSAGQEEA